MRRLTALVKGLPIGCRTFAAETGGWTPDTHLLAVVADRLDLVHRDLHGLGGAKRPPKPNPVPRPADRKTKPAASPAALARMMIGGG